MNTQANNSVQSVQPADSYRAYLVRLWQDSPQAPWRASAQPADGGEIVRFADLDALCSYLIAHTKPGPPTIDFDNSENASSLSA